MYNEPIESSQIDAVIPFLKKKIGNYVGFMRTFLKPDSKVLFAGQIDREALQAMLNSNNECSGIRVYLIKGTEDVSKDDVGFLFVPLKTGTDGAQEDILVEDGSADGNKFNLSESNRIFLTDVDCPSDVCRPPRGSKLVPDNY